MRKKKKPAKKDFLGPEWKPLADALAQTFFDMWRDAENGERMARGLPLLTEDEIEHARKRVGLA